MEKMIQEKENEIYKNIKEYFNLVSIKDLKPSSWRVPIGGGFYGADEVNDVVKCYLQGSLSIQKSVISELRLNGLKVNVVVACPK